MQLGSIKALYTDKLRKLYAAREAENIFYEVLYALEKKSRTALLLGQETLLLDSYTEILSELLSGKPLQYVLQITPFYNLDLYVDERVLIPRPETEQLVHWVLEDNPDFKGSVLDIGTGSGCIPLVLKKHWPQATVSGYDISEDALKVATLNAENLDLDVSFVKLDILTEELPDCDLIVSNPPYIGMDEKNQMADRVLDFEPHIALFVDQKDPLLFYKRILELASKKRTTCYFETSEFYRKELDTWLLESNITHTWQLDFQEKNRMLKVTW